MTTKFKDTDGMEITVGKLSNTRRMRMCYHHDGEVGRDGRIDRNWCYPREGKQPHDTFLVTMPNGLKAYVDRGGSYSSYIDHAGIAQDMTKDLALVFDHYIIEVTGITDNKQLTN